jgi:SNF2 family DNA or RNA helicase
VIAVRLICPNTIEDKILKLQATKRELSGKLVKTDTQMFKSMKKEELLNLL